MTIAPKPSMPILRESPDQIYRRIANRLTAMAKDRGETPPATEEGEFYYDLLYPLSEEISEQQQLLEYAFLQGFLPWAEGEYLDGHGYLLGLARKEAETDDAYRERLLIRARTEEGTGRRIDYEAWAREVPGVGGAVAIEQERHDVSIDLYLTDSNGEPVTPEFARKVKDLLWETKRIAGHDLDVLPAPVFPVKVSVSLALEREVDQSQVISLITRRIKEYMKGRSTIVYQQIGGLFFVEGVVDFSNYRLNDGTQNLFKPLKAVAELNLVVLS